MLPDRTIVIPPSKDNTIACDDDGGLPFLPMSDSNNLLIYYLILIFEKWYNEK
jgi:hypothetical protein